MRSTARLLQASVKYLTPGAPTGLTGVTTHHTPRAALLYLYSSTISKLQAFPESSVYRQSTEALSKHRLSIVESIVPEGYEAWQSSINQKVQEHPGILESLSHVLKKGRDGKLIVLPARTRAYDERTEEWDGEEVVSFTEGSKNPREAARQARELEKEPTGGLESDNVSLELEPALTAQQINEIEQKIGAGLIEEVIQVAKDEHALVDKMLEYKPWEELIEKAPEGQWTYFERSSHMKPH